MTKLKVTISFETIYDLNKEHYDERNGKLTINQKVDHTLKHINLDPWIPVHNCTEWKTKGEIIYDKLTKIKTSVMSDTILDKILL